MNNENNMQMGEMGEMGEMIFFATNAQPMNEVVAHKRMPDGSLKPMGSYATGGVGAGIGPLAPFHDPLGSQGSLAVDRAHKLLFVVNACSDTVSTFRIGDDGPMLAGQTPSGGNFPVSLVVHGNMLYVLNAGGDGAITGFNINMDGKLMPMMNSTRTLGVGGKQPPFVFTVPGQIDISPDGKWLVVIEKGIKNEDVSTHKIHVFGMTNGLPAAKPVTTPSLGWLPFASVFSKSGHLLVVEAFGKGPIMANTGAVTSYEISIGGNLKPVTVSADTHNNEACWIALAGDYAYVTNFAAHAITGFKVMSDGRLSELNLDGKTVLTGEGSFPVDMVVSRDGNMLYALLPGTKSLAAYRIGMDGALMMSGMAMGEWPVGVQGLAVY